MVPQPPTAERVQEVEAWEAVKKTEKTPENLLDTRSFLLQDENSHNIYRLNLYGVFRNFLH